MNDLDERAQGVLADYLPPDSSISKEDAISRLLGILDGPEQREVQGKVRDALTGGRPAFFG